MRNNQTKYYDDVKKVLDNSLLLTSYLTSLYVKYVIHRRLGLCWIYMKVVNREQIKLYQAVGSIYTLPLRQIVAGDIALTI